MTIEAQQIGRRFAALSPEARRQFLKKLEDNGVDFASLPIVPAPRSGDLPLSYAQRGLWLTWQRDPASAAYNLGGRLAIDGALDAVALEGGLADLVARHEPLRTVFHLDTAGEPGQRVLDDAPLGFVMHDFEGSDDGDALSAAHARDLVGRPFDLETAPLLRIELHRLPGGRSGLAIALHHIVVDGESVGMILDELSALYLARLTGRPAPLPPLPVQFADYVSWQRNWLEAGARERQLGFWTETLGDSHPPLDLPLDRPRKAARGAVEGGGYAFRLPADVSARLRAVARQEGASTFMAVLALFDLLLARHCGQDDIRVGAPLSNRRRAETHPMVGYFANMAVLRTVIDQRESFADLLGRVRDGLLAAVDNLDLPFDAVVEALRPPRREGVHPLFQVKCTEQKAGAGERTFGGFAMTAHSLDAGEAHFDLSFDVTDEAEGVACFFAYARDLFDPATIERLADDFTALADAATADPQRRLADLPPGGASAPATAARTAAIDPVDAWRRSVTEQPDALALVQEGRTFTRAELDRASDALALRLAAMGVGPETRVALQAPRSPEWVLGVLAILKAGGAYVPLDPTTPRERRAELMADSGARLLVVTGACEDDLGCATVTASFDDDEPAQHVPSAQITAGQAAYVIYTSGSTGKPKGVMVTRGGLAAYVRGAIEAMALPAGARMAMVSTVAADLGNTMLFGALCGGGELHLLDASRAFDPDRFAGYMAEHRIDALKITPSHLQALLQARAAADVLPAHTLALGGEATGWELLERIRALAPSCRVINHYGPTETTVGALFQKAEEADRSAATLPIGAPLGGATAHVVDVYLNPSPQAVAGELFIGGESLARGYAGRPGQTAERFVPDPFGPAGGRLYRTGDRVRRRSGGAIEFLGRVDDQVKIRGYRVEPGEVAAALRAIQGVADAFVAAVEANGATRLVAYVAGGEDLEPGVLSDRLAANLPDYMVPSEIIRLDALPVTANGKIDRGALPQAPVTRSAGDPPRGGTETALAAIWSELLGIASVARDDGFIALGGDSILSLKLLARIRKQGLVAAGRKLSLADVLNAQTLADLAAHIAPAAPTEPDVVHLRSGGGGLPLFCLPGLTVNSTEFLPMVEAFGGGGPVQGFVSHVFTEQRWRGYAVQELAQEYAAHIERTATGGRCALLGWSSGGDLAFETAHQLQGRVAIDFLGLVDVFEPVDLRTDRVLSDAERHEAEDLLERWLGRSAMADRWRTAFAPMNPAEREATLVHVLERNGDLPVDGPDMNTQEFELWAEVDKKVRAARHAHRPLDVPVHVWQAEDSLGRPEPLRDWSLLAPVIALERIAGATHLDIIRAPAFHRSVGAALARLTVA